MKKITLILMALLLSISLTACVTRPTESDELANEISEGTENSEGSDATVDSITATVSDIVTALRSEGSDEEEETDAEETDVSEDSVLNKPISEFYTIPYADCDLSSYITLSSEDYMGLTIEGIESLDNITVTDTEVSESIYADLQANATYVDVDRGAQVGDSINIDFTGSVDGVEFDGGTAEGYDMILGEAGFIDGFEDALVGHMAGEEFDIDVTFPEDYGSEELNGKAAKFAIKMNSIQEEVLPELTEEFVINTFGYESLSEYVTDIYSQLLYEKQYEAESTVKTNAYTLIYEKAVISGLPEEDYNFYYNDFIDYYTEMATYYGTTLEELIPMLGVDSEEFYAYADENAVLYVEQELICFAIAQQEGLIDNLTKAEYDAFVAELAEANGVDAQTFETENDSSQILKSFILETAIAFVIENRAN